MPRSQSSSTCDSMMRRREAVGTRRLPARRAEPVPDEPQRRLDHTLPHQLRLDVDEPRVLDHDARSRPAWPRRASRGPRRAAATARPAARAVRAGTGTSGCRTSSARRPAAGRGTSRRRTARRDGKWNAASTLITPSNEPSANGSRVASPFTACAPASASRWRPATSCDSVMLSATSRRVSATVGDHADPAPPTRSRRRARRPPCRQRLGDRLDQPADRDRRLGRIAPVPLPETEVQPPGSERDEEVLADAVVDGGGRVLVRSGASRRRA